MDLHDMPTTGTGQSCALCGSPEVVWIHPLDRDLLTYQVIGKGQTLPTFWTLCGRCEEIYQSGDDDGAVAVMHASTWSWVADNEVTECIGKPLAAFRRADLGARRLDTEPSAVIEARSRGFIPLRELTGVGEDLGPLWPAEHRLWLEDLGPVSSEDEDDEELDRWLVRSPWPTLSVSQTMTALWRWVERDPRPRDEAWTGRARGLLTWTEPEALVFTQSID
jgi:hypothetical protein